ncbi:galactoside 2-alpha-L-fucosyltransferase SEC1-like [Physella acuta]|uniref:galactoside 2-alpha-L-fucosyltransferase SEC1-like n=1 Tax=Physella acuta TaxID=109671 RepID=UPI0027DDC4A0|nr:galactoside 2-alpha-L-fucosyltransferase SEC1-like [Physella acuta]
MKSLHIKAIVIITFFISVFIFCKHFKDNSDKETCSHIATKESLTARGSFSTDARVTLINISSTNHPLTSAPSTQPATPALYVLVTSGNFVHRLGNQLFICASLLGIARKQNRIPILEDGKDLVKAFEINVGVNKIKATGWDDIHQRMVGIYEPKFMNLPQKNVTVSGSLQSWRFFSHIQDEIRREFTFRPIIQQKTTRFYNSLRENYTDTVFIGVHVRRADFLTPDNLKLGFQSPDVAYFTKAFNYMRSIVSNNTLFIVASDDLEWCRVNLNHTDVKLLEPDSPENHMSILSSSDHVIITGGSFGWWSAWLARGLKIYFKGFPNPGTKLAKEFNLRDYYPPGWIGLDN